jgi:Domain of unknown function (DUF6894)
MAFEHWTHVPLFYFRIGNGDYSGTSGEGFDLADRDAAWAEMTRVCGDLVGSIARKLKQQTEWRMELLDESRKPVFRVRLMAETLDQPAVSGSHEPAVKSFQPGDPSDPRSPHDGAGPTVELKASPGE